MDISVFLGEGSNAELFARAVWYTLIYAAIVFVPLRVAILVIARAKAASARRKEAARTRKARRLRSIYVIR